MATDSEVKFLVPLLESELPMKLSRKQWTRWTLAKNGRSYVGRKVVQD